MNHFEFFDIPISFYPNEVELRQRFLKNSKLYHPDFHTLESDERQAEILEKSTQNNEAYLTLSNFDKRLAYILDLKGLLETGQNELPQDFLMEMMEINEAIMELEFDFDEVVFQATLNNANQLESSLLEGIQPVLANYVEGVTSVVELEIVRDFYLKRKYLWRIKNNLDKFAPASKEVH